MRGLVEVLLMPDVRIHISCSECGNDLNTSEIDVEGVDLGLKIDPCKSCMEWAKREALLNGETT